MSRDKVNQIMNINQISARLANDTSTTHALFQVSATAISKLSAQLENNAQGTANFQVFENNVQKIDQNVTGGGSISYIPKQPGSRIDFYVNYYNANDLPSALVMME